MMITVTVNQQLTSDQASQDTAVLPVTLPSSCYYYRRPAGTRHCSELPAQTLR